jgi:hypothetical protein
MAKSVTEPISLAFERTKQMLFKPFDVRKWFVLGFAAFLAQLGEGGGGGGNNFRLPGGWRMPKPTPPAPVPAPFPPTPGMPPMPGVPGVPGVPGTPGMPRFPSTTFPTPPTPQEEFASFIAWLKQFIVGNLYWMIPAAIVVLAIMVVLMWLRARGKFIFLDGVANDRAAIAEPWSRLAPQANSYFRFTVAIGALWLLFMVGSILLVYVIARPDIEAQQFGGASVAAIAVGLLVFIASTFIFGIISVLTEDFVIPLMYLRITTIGPAWNEFRQNLLPGNVGSIVLFYLMRFVLAIATGVIAAFAACLTCMIAALPYIGTVVFLPLFVFHRCYSLYFLRQFGGDYNLIVERVPQMMSAFPVIMPPQPPPVSDYPPIPQPPDSPPPPPPPPDSPRRL